MFLTAPGVTVPFPERLREEFQVYEHRAIQANVSYEKLESLVREFYRGLEEPLFFVLQLPLSIDEEKKLGNDRIIHDEVLYLDLQTQGQIDEIMDSFGPILLEDGMSRIAIASHASHEEIFVQKYKIIELFAPSPRRFIPLLQRYGLQETDHLLTAWNTFTQDTPGECRRVTRDGLDAYDVADILKQRGMYRANVIEP